MNNLCDESCQIKNKKEGTNFVVFFVLHVTKVIWVNMSAKNNKISTITAT